MSIEPTLPQGPPVANSEEVPILTSWGKFQLRERVGHGSFGEVYRAWDSELEREVALKLLLPHVCAGEEALNTILREARAMAAIRHPNVVPVYGVDRCLGRVGFWADFVHGRTVADLLLTQGPFGHREAALIGIDVCKALSAVHRAGLLHRDIKAENVMREEGGRILLMDFGLSGTTGHDSYLTGTPFYMAPELFKGGAATVSSDIFAVGVLLFHLVSGEYPLRLTELKNEEGTQLSLDRRLLVDCRSDLPESFLSVVNRAINRDPAQRFVSAGQLSAALSETIDPGIPAHHRLLHERSTARPFSRSAVYVGSALFLVLLSGLLFHDRIERLFHPRAAATLSPGNYDDFVKAQDLLRRNDKEANVTEAVRLLSAIVQRDPRSALAHAGLGEAYFQADRKHPDPDLLRNARNEANSAVSLDPGLPLPYITLARLDSMAGRSPLALHDVQRALELDPRSSEAWAADAVVLDSAGRGPEAEAAAQKAIDLAPDDWRWPVLLGSYHFARRDLDDAEKDFRQAATITPDNALAYLDLGIVEIQLGRYADARTSLEKALAIHPTFAVYTAIGELLTLQGEFARAAEMNRKAIELNPASYLSWGNLAASYQWSPDGKAKARETYGKAVELAEKARRQTPEDPRLLAILGGYYASLGSPEKSLPLIRKATALAPENAEVLYRSGEANEILGRRPEAIGPIARALALGYRPQELERSPELASLRSDPAFQAAVARARAEHNLDKIAKTP